MCQRCVNNKAYLTASATDRLKLDNWYRQETKIALDESLSRIKSAARANTSVLDDLETRGDVAGAWLVLTTTNKLYPESMTPEMKSDMVNIAFNYAMEGVFHDIADPMSRDVHGVHVNVNHEYFAQSNRWTQHMYYRMAEYCNGCGGDVLGLKSAPANPAQTNTPSDTSPLGQQIEGDFDVASLTNLLGAIKAAIANL